MVGQTIHAHMEMFCKILADSINKYNDRITTFLIYIPHVYLLDFYKDKYINISYSVLQERKYVPSTCREGMNNYYWRSGLDFFNNVNKTNIINLSVSYAACIMTSTKWSEFFSKLYFVHTQNTNYYENDYLDFLTKLENTYIENSKNVKFLNENDWHLMDIVSNKQLPIMDKVRLQFTMYLKVNVNANFNPDLVGCKSLFSKNISEEKASVYNHIVKVPVEYNYLTNGLFDKKWDNKSKKLQRGYNDIYDSYLCLYDILEELKLKL